IDRVHHDAADRRTHALPAHATGLAPVNVGLLGVAHLADSRAAARVDVANLARGQAQLRVRSVLRDQAHRGTGGTRELRAPTRLELDRVDHRTGRDVAQ